MEKIETITLEKSWWKLLPIIEDLNVQNEDCCINNNTRKLWNSCSFITKDPLLWKCEQQRKITLWPESTSELYRPSGRRLSAKLLPTFANRGCHMVSVTDPYGHIFGFLDWSCYFFFQIAPQLYSWGWVDPIPVPLLHRKSGSAGNRTRNSGSVARSSDH
jgi:hypothetical protein